MRKLNDPSKEGTSEVKPNKQARQVKVTADGAGVVSHAGAGLLREMATSTGLVEAVSQVLLDTYRARPLHQPGQVFAISRSRSLTVRTRSAGSRC